MIFKTIVLIVVIIAILLSSFKKQKKTDGATPRRAVAVPPNVEEWLPHSPVFAALQEQKRKLRPEPGTLDLPKVPYIPVTPEQEGVHAIVPPIDDEDVYAEPHPDVPAATDWRRAVIAHEILKTKF